MSLIDTVETVERETNSSFSTKIPNLQIGIDSTSLGDFKTCPRLYQYRIVQGYGISTAGSAENPHIKFGHIYHGASEVYDKARADGYDHELALIEALYYAIHASWDAENNRPWISTEPTKTLKTLLRTIIWYYDKFKDDPLKTYIKHDGTAAVELSFRFSLADTLEGPAADYYIAPSGEPYVLCGHLDRVVEWNGDLWIVDKKTTKGELNDRYFDKYNPDNQMSLYTIAGQIVLHTDVEGVIIDAAQVLVGSSRFRRKPISRTNGQLEEWLGDLRYYLRLMEICAQRNYWPMNDKSCDMYGGCKFRPVCGADPSVRGELLDAFYTDRRTWDPLKPR